MINRKLERIRQRKRRLQEKVAKEHSARRKRIVERRVAKKTVEQRIDTLERTVRLLLEEARTRDIDKLFDKYQDISPADKVAIAGAKARLEAAKWRLR